jgi:thiamine pyrophosphokinase
MLSIIFANGDLHPNENPLQINDGDLVIAADGGSRHCQDLGIIPGVLIGDMDSTHPDLILAWEGLGVEVIRYPEDKDQTDLELALLHAQSEGATKIVVYGAIGGRLDMTLGNLILLAHPDLNTLVKLVYGNEEVRLLGEGELLTLPGEIGDKVSLISMNPEGAILTTKGLQYALNKQELRFGFTRGISNRLMKKQATIHLEKGLLAVIHTQGDSLEERLR